MRRIFLMRTPVLGLAVLAACTQAQKFPVQTEDQIFRSVKGKTEFTGMLIVRPKPLDLCQGRSEWKANQIRAQRELRGLVVRRQARTDEYTIRIPKGYDENSFSRKLIRTGAFQYAVPNFKVWPAGNPNDPNIGNQWFHPVINSPRAWDTFTGSTNITIAITDTGVDYNHPDLAANCVSGYNSWQQISQANGGPVIDINGHGTHVAGCAAAIGNNGVGISGAAWNLHIMPVRVSDEPDGTTTFDALFDGAIWAADHGADVVNCSFSGVDYAPVQTTGAYLRSQACLYFYAAGNDNRNLSMFDWPDVIVVGGTDPADAKYSASAYGLGVDVYAPATSIYSCVYNTTGYGSGTGTSFATPIVVGIAGMIFAAVPNITPQQVEDAIETGCKDLGTPGNDTTWGWGRVDSYNALANATSKVVRNPLNGHYYRRWTARLTRAAASTVATSSSYYDLAGYMATVTNTDENQFMVNTMQGAYIGKHWLGGSQSAFSVEPAGGWSWVTAEPWSYTNWLAGQPNNGSSGTEDSLEFNYGSTVGAWNDAAPGITNAGVIIEYAAPTPVPLSGSITLAGYLNTSPVQSVDLTIKDMNGDVLQTSSVPVASNGSFSLSVSVRGPVQLEARGTHWLRKKLGNYEITGAGCGTVSGTLTNGDIVQDNVVDLGDWDAFVLAFGSELGDTNYSTQSDLDGSGSIDLGDFDVLAQSFGQEGD